MKKILKNVITHPLFSGSAIMIIGSNSVSFINYLYHFVMGRMLGPANYGELVSLISLIGLLGMIPGAASLVIVKQFSSAKDVTEINNLIGWFKTKIFIFSLIFSLLILIFSPYISSFLNINKVSYLILISIFFLFSLQSGFIRAILQGLLKFKEMVLSILVENGLKLILSILLVYLGFQIGGVMIALVISSLLGFYITNSYLKHTSVHTSFSPDVKSMLTFILPVTIQSIAVTSLYSSDVILVKHFFPAHEAGIYAALSTLGKIIFFGTGPIAAVMFPLVSRRKATGQNYRKIFFNSFIATSMLAIIISVVYWLIPSFAINLLYGGAYIEAADLLIWFGIFMSLFTLSSLLINFNLSLGKTKVVILPLIAAFIQIVLIWFYHQNLLTIVLESTLITALLLVLLLIYSIYGGKLNINNSSRFQARGNDS
ncbi:MAG: oligosaccharide flippase family protein [Candidatus Daviesbacteria bacterium]|nr:oligosaccharide flippase family protein [Candidatus Daviesbacteria bacterium]